MRRQPVLAIDVGSTAIAWAIGQPRLDQSVLIPGQPPHAPFELLGWGTVDMEGPGFHDPTRLAQVIERALKDVTVAPVPDRASVCLSHPTLSHHHVTTQVDLADEPIMIRQTDLERLRSLAVSQAMPIDHELLCLEPLGYAGNGFSGVADPRGLTATRVRGTFHLVTMPLALRRALLQALEFLGIELDGLTYRPKALVAGGVLGKGRGCVAGERLLLVDGDGEVCDLALMDHGRLVKAATLNVRCQTPSTNSAGFCAEGLAPVSDDQEIRSFLHNETPPVLAIITGRIGLVDGMVEHLEQTTGVKTLLGRSPWAKPLGDLSRQVAAGPILGMLALTTIGDTKQFQKNGLCPQSSRLIDRLLRRTKHILVDYF